MHIRYPRPGGVTLFVWVKQQLLESIALGEFTPNEPFITQREVVERFGVSSTTAVRALNELAADGVVVRKRGRGTFVSPSTTPRGKPESFADPVLTYVCAEAGGSHEWTLLAGLSVTARALGYRVTVEHTRNVLHEEQVVRTIDSTSTIGLVIFARERSVAGNMIENLRRLGLPVVLVRQLITGTYCDAVLFDDLALGHDVATAVIARGHQHIGLLWGRMEPASARVRQAGVLRALRAHGIAQPGEHSAISNFDCLETAVRRGRLRSWLAGSSAPSALICDSGTTLALASSDLATFDEIGETVELAMLDQPSMHAPSPVAVVAARIPSRRIGEEAAHIIHARIAGNLDPPRHLLLPASLEQEPLRNHSTPTNT